MTLSDLQQYKVVKAPPLSVPLGELTLHTFTAPSGGPVLALISQIIHGMPRVCWSVPLPVCLSLSISACVSACVCIFACVPFLSAYLPVFFFCVCV